MARIRGIILQSGTDEDVRNSTTSHKANLFPSLNNASCCIPCIQNQATVRHNLLVVECGMVCGDEHTILLTKESWSQFLSDHVRKSMVSHPGKSGDPWVTVGYYCSPLKKQFGHFKCRTFTRIINVFLICHSKERDS